MSVKQLINNENLLNLSKYEIAPDNSEKLWWWWLNAFDVYKLKSSSDFGKLSFMIRIRCLVMDIDIRYLSKI